MQKQRYRWRLTLVGWFFLGVAFAIFGASFVHRVNLLLLVFALMLSAVVTSARMGRRQIRKVAIKRSFPSLVPVGRPFVTTLEIQSTDTKAPLIGLSVGETANPTTPGPPERSRGRRLDEVPANQVLKAPLVRTFSSRGSYRLGPIRLRSDFPLGMVRWQTDISPVDEPLVVVHPPIGQLQPLGRQRLGIHGPGEGKPHLSIIEGIDEFRGVRDYRPGDSARLVHWRSTARRGSLVVREMDPAAGRGILLVVFLVPSPTSNNPDLVDQLLSFVSTLIVDVSRDPTLVLTLLIVGKEPTLIRGAMTSARAPSYLRALALAEPTRQPDDLEQARRLLRENDTRDRKYWIVSLAGTAPPGAPAWPILPTRQLAQPVVLNASAGDLEPLWVPPTPFRDPP